MISGVDLKSAQPWEVDSKIEELLKQWEDSGKTFEDIIKDVYKRQYLYQTGYTCRRKEDYRQCS